MPKPRKRSAHYTPRIAKRICEHIALGDTLRQALDKEPLGPTMPNFWRWLDEFPEFREQYDRARQMQGDTHADRMMEIAQEVIAHPSKAAAYRVAMDILKWQAEVRDQRKYGAKVKHEFEPPMKPDEIKKQIHALERELGVDPTKTKKDNTQSEAEANPAPAPNPLKDLTCRTSVVAGCST